MYYSITNSIGTEVEVEGKTLVCGNLYANKLKAPKDVDYLLAFSKTENPVDGLVWRFEGKADLDYSLFCKTHVHHIEGLNVDDFDKVINELSELLTLAWKSERINIQARIRPIRPAKDSKKAIESVRRQDLFAALNAELAAGEITIEQFAEKTRQIIAAM